MTATQIIVTLIVVAVVIVLAAGAWTMWRRQTLRNRFGPEYDRVLSEQPSRSAAEKELRDRQRNHAALNLKPLPEPVRARYEKTWQDVQAHFVDDPSGTVRAADALLTRLIAETGYPVDDYDAELAHLSVEHSRTVDRYRAAHEISQRPQASTEELRQAVTHYHALFAELLGADPLVSTPLRSQPSSSR